MENFYNKKEVKKYCIKGENPNYDLHNFDVPFRGLVIAPSGSGKSTFITNLITLFAKVLMGLLIIFIFFVNQKTRRYTNTSQIKAKV